MELAREVIYQLSQAPMNSLQGTSFTWSLLSTEISYITHMDILNSFSSLPLHTPIKEVEFPEIHDQLPDEYLDRFIEFRLTLFSTSHFDEYHDISTTYLGRLMKDQRNDFLLREFSLENDVQLNASCMAAGCLLD